MTDMKLTASDLGAAPGEAPWEDLRLAILLQAVEDRRRARATLRRHPDHREATRLLREVNRFFRSDWFEALAGMTGREFLMKLERSEEEQRKERFRYEVFAGSGATVRLSRVYGRRRV